MCKLFFLKQKTAYEMRISDWSSAVLILSRRCVEQADRIADRKHLAANRGFLGFIPFPVPGGAEPASILFHLRTGGHLLVMRCQARDRHEILSDRPAGKAPDRHRVERWPELRSADRLVRLAQEVREHANTRDIGRLALIRSHAKRGVAFEVLHRAATLARGQQIGR